MTQPTAEALQELAGIVQDFRPAVGFGENGTLSIEWDLGSFSLHVMFAGEAGLEAYMCASDGTEYEWSLACADSMKALRELAVGMWHSQQKQDPIGFAAGIREGRRQVTSEMVQASPDDVALTRGMWYLLQSMLQERIRQAELDGIGPDDPSSKYRTDLSERLMWHELRARDVDPFLSERLMWHELRARDVDPFLVGEFDDD